MAGSKLVTTFEPFLSVKDVEALVESVNVALSDRLTIAGVENLGLYPKFCAKENIFSHT